MAWCYLLGVSVTKAFAFCRATASKPARSWRMQTFHKADSAIRVESSTIQSSVVWTFSQTRWSLHNFGAFYDEKIGFTLWGACVLRKARSS